MLASATLQASLPNTVALDLEDSPWDYLAFGFPKDSELAPLFRSFFLKLWETGTLRNICQKWIPKPPKVESGGWEALGYDNLAFPFFFLVFGTLAAILVALSEICEIVRC